MLNEYEELNDELLRHHLSGEDAFHALFDQEVWEEITSGGQEWLDIVKGMQTQPPDNPADLEKTLSRLRNNNARWMNMSAKQFTSVVAQYCRME